MATTQAPRLPASMPAAVYRGSGEVAVEDRPVPQPGAGEVLVEVGHCGICGSDLYLIGENLGSPGTVMGHEYSGVVAALGEGVTGWAVGDEVVGGPAPRCGQCRRCLEGQPSQCEVRRRVMTDTTGRSPASSWSTRGRWCGCPRGWAGGRRPWPSHWRWRCTASPAPTSGRGTPPW